MRGVGRVVGGVRPVRCPANQCRPEVSLGKGKDVEVGFLE